MTTNIWVLVFQWFAGFGLFLAFLLARNTSTERKHIGMMAALVFAFAISLIQFTFLWSGQRMAYLHFSGVWCISSLLFGPLLWLYIQYERRSAIIWDVLHFLPTESLWLKG